MKPYQALRQLIYATLTATPLTYTLDGNTDTLPVANVQPKAIWNTGGAAAPSPLIAFSVSEREAPMRALQSNRAFDVRLWVVSSGSEDEVAEIYEAVAARLSFADQSAPAGVTDLSRGPQGNGGYAVAVREFRTYRVSDIEFEKETNRWYLTAEYVVIAA